MLALGSLSWHHAGGRKCALERLGQQLLSSTLPAVERSMRSVGSYTWEASRFLCAQKYCRNLNPLLSCFRRDPADQVPFECFFISDLFNTLQVPLWAPPPRSPCVRVPHLSFGCCADGSLLVLHNGSKVSAPHAINTLKLLHSSCLVALFAAYPKKFSVKHQGPLLCIRLNCGLEFRGSYKTADVAERTSHVNTLRDIILFLFFSTSETTPFVIISEALITFLDSSFLDVSAGGNLCIWNKADSRITDQPEK